MISKDKLSRFYFFEKRGLWWCRNYGSLSCRLVWILEIQHCFSPHSLIGIFLSYIVVKIP